MLCTLKSTYSFEEFWNRDFYALGDSILIGMLAVVCSEINRSDDLQIYNVIFTVKFYSSYVK